MFEFLKGREQKLIEAIESGDLETLGPLLNKFDASSINAPLKDGQTAAELALAASQARALALILAKGGDASACDQQGQPLTALALAQADSLSLLSVLLAAGADVERPDSEGRSLIQQCAQRCSDSQLPLHLSRLQQHGVDLNSEPALLLDAMQQFNQPLIQFLINSGCTPPAETAQLPAEAVTYANRLVEDYRIQQQFLGR